MIISNYNYIIEVVVVMMLYRLNDLSIINRESFNCFIVHKFCEVRLIRSDHKQFQVRVEYGHCTVVLTS